MEKEKLSTESTTIEYGRGASGKMSCRVKVVRLDGEKAMADAKSFFNSTLSNLESHE